MSKKYSKDKCNFLNSLSFSKKCISANLFNNVVVLLFYPFLCLSYLFTYLDTRHFDSWRRWQLFNVIKYQKVIQLGKTFEDANNAIVSVCHTYIVVISADFWHLWECPNIWTALKYQWRRMVCQWPLRDSPESLKPIIQ